MDKLAPNHLGEPDVKFGNLCIWIHGRENENLQDYWDGNWLRATTHYGAQNCEAWATGSILHLSELLGWMKDLKELYRVAKGEARLQCMEPNLSILINLGKTGRGEIRVEITPDHMAQGHWFLEPIDQSYLPGLIEALENILKRYPLRGEGILKAIIGKLRGR